MGNNEIGNDKNEGESLAISIAMAMQRTMWAHRPIEHVQVFNGSHWMPPSGKCLRHIALAAAVVNELIEITQNTNTTQLLANNYGTFRSLDVWENFIPQNRPSTQLIDTTSFV